MNAVPYSDDYRNEWDKFVKHARNATFLFERDFMDYHQHRFEDLSLLFYSDNGKLSGLFPASAHRQTATVCSHGGLTYGGLLLGAHTRSTEVLDMETTLLSFYKEAGFKQLVVKPVPYIYHRSPSDDELYALFRNGAQLRARSLSTAIRIDLPLSLSTLRRRRYKLAQNSGLQICSRGNYSEFWSLLTTVLKTHHGVTPVHSLAEIELLQSRFPENIRLCTVLNNQGTTVGGTLLFLTEKTIHAQYIAASSEGRRLGALDFLFAELLKKEVLQSFVTIVPTYFDFGISTEQQGTKLNSGLLFQKEGFGGHAIVYDEYSIAL